MPAPPPDQNPQTWLITGCSRGLGREIALAALARGDKVIATARRQSDLAYLENETRALILQLDVCEDEDSIRSKVEAAVETFGAIDVLVNNAGFVVAGVWEELSDEDVRRQFDTGFFGALKLTRILLGHMRPRRRGVIFFMGSIAGSHGAAASGPYASSKFALEGAAECLDREVKHFGIRAHVLVLGRFRTNILSEDNKEGSLSVQGLEDYTETRKKLQSSHTASHGRQPGDPKRAAQGVVDLAKAQNLTQAQVDSLPLRIPFGAEAVGVMEAKAKSSLDQLSGWEEFARRMDFEEQDLDLSSFIE